MSSKPPSKHSFQSSELANTFRIALLFGVRMLGLFMIFPVFSMDAELNFSATPVLIGIALGIYGLTQASLQIPFGLLSDKYGRKKLIIIGLLFFIAGSLIAATAEDIYQLIIGRALQGCGAIASVLLAYLADLTNVGVRIRAMALVGMSIGSSFLLSLLIGPVLYHYIGLSGIFYGTALLGMVGLILLFSINDKSQISPHRALEYKFSFSAIQAVCKTKSLWSLNLIVMSIHACITLIFLFIPALLVQNDIDFNQHWQVYLFTMLISLIMALPLIIWTEKKQTIRPMIIFALSLLIFALFIFFKHHSFMLLLSALSVFFVSFNVLEALLPSSVSRIAAVQYRGMALGLFSSHQFMGSFIGGLLGGIMLNYYGIFGLLSSAIMLVTLCLILFVMIPMDIRKRSQSFTIKKDYPVNQVQQWSIKQAGVLEAIYQQDSGALYLKTDLNDFDGQVFKQGIEQQFK